MISSNTIQAVKDASILDVIGHYVTLRKRGAYYLAPCPFHDDRKPSFTVHPIKGKYKCFGCGASGNALTFVMNFEKKTYIEAVELIASISEIAIETEQKTKWTKRTQQKPVIKKVQPEPFDCIPTTLLDHSLPDIESNPLTSQIAAIVGTDVIQEVVDEYKITTEGCWITFPQIDHSGNYRTGKSICYDIDGHRANVNPKWVHYELKRKNKLHENFILKQCFTGEHLLSKYRDRPVAVVEGQSTMILMAALGIAALRYNIKELHYFAGFTWLSTGGSDGIGWKDKQVMKALKGKEVVLFPDAGFYDQWASDAEQMQENGIRVQVSQLIEAKYTEGLLKYNVDLKDYFMMYAGDIKQLCMQKPVQINTDDIITLIGETHTGTAFDKMIIFSIKTNDSTLFDLLFDSSGELIKPGERVDAVNKLASYYEKNFQPALFENLPCLIHITQI